MLNTLPSEKRKCHLCHFEKSCRELVLSGACERWAQIKGTHPQTGADLDQWGCIDDLQHLLLLEIGNQTSKVSVELNVLRNETAKAHQEHTAMGAMAVQRSVSAIKGAFRDAAQMLVPVSEPTKLIENSKAD